MTSIVSPLVYATLLATKAQDNLAQASTLLRGAGYSPASESANPTPPIHPSNGADRLADNAIQAIDRALAIGVSLSTDVTTAFTRAKDQALAGVAALQTPNAPHSPVLSFDAAGMWLGLAKNLLAVEQGGTQPNPGVIQLPDPSSPIQ